MVLNLVSLLATLIGLALAWYTFDQSKRKPHLRAHYQESLRLASLGQYIGEQGDLELKFGDLQISEAWYLQVIIINDGDEVIDLSLADEPLLLRTQSSSRVFQLSKLETSRKLLSVKLESSSSGIVARVRDFSPGDFFTFDVMLLVEKGRRKLELVCNENTYKCTIPVIDFPFGSSDGVKTDVEKVEDFDSSRRIREREMLAPLQGRHVPASTLKSKVPEFSPPPKGVRRPDQTGTQLASRRGPSLSLKDMSLLLLLGSPVVYCVLSMVAWICFMFYRSYRSALVSVSLGDFLGEPTAFAVVGAAILVLGPIAFLAVLYTVGLLVSRLQIRERRLRRHRELIAQRVTEQRVHQALNLPLPLALRSVGGFEDS